MLFLRALLAFLMLPTVVAGVLPWLLLRGNSYRGTLATPLGWPVISLGLFILLWCVRDFYVRGHGTLAPWDPPKKLVVLGLYKFVRNPMYIGVLTILAGWTLLSGSSGLAIYTLTVAIMFHLRVILFEEPTLTRLFGAEFSQYCSAVKRWLPKRPLRLE